MCAIFGMVGRRDHAGLREAALSLRHRGPDGFGEWASADREVYLAHCRLAIIDLSDAGRQPMASEDGALQLSYNGEIYNFGELRVELEARGHRFRSRTDSEVLLRGYAEWGDAVVSRLRGIFAFAVWDERRRRLFLARDRLGVKPLYYTLRGGEFAFASEPRALIRVSPTAAAADAGAVVQFLRRGFSYGHQSIWNGVERLPPACTLSFHPDTGAAVVDRYWRRPDVDPQCSQATALEEIDHLLDSAVREQLAADVPVGCFLSGGLDSSLVSSFAAQHAPGVRTFFADFPGWKGSEREDAHSVASYLGTSHVVEEIDSIGQHGSGASDVAALFEAYDEPIADLAVVPTWFLSRAMARHVKVALSGDGGDELFAGYRRYRNPAGNARRRASWAVERIRRRLGMGRQWPSGCANASEYYHLQMCPSFATDELARLFPEWLGADAAENPEIPVARARSGLSTRDCQLWDLDSYTVDSNLARMDRGSMAHGLEVRVPMFDHRLVELALSLPGEMNSPDDGGKFALRNIAQRKLPQSVLHKAKQGFSFPLERFVAAEAMRDCVRNGSLVRAGMLNAKALDRWIAEDLGSNHRLKLWLLFVLEQWAGRWLFEQRATGVRTAEVAA